MLFLIMFYIFAIVNIKDDINNFHVLKRCE